MVLDLGRTVHGRLTADVSGPSGAIVDIGWDERVISGTLRPLPYPGSLHPQWNQVDSWILDGTTRSISTIDARAGRYILIAAWGNSQVRISNLQVYEEHYPLVQKGEFHSSDPLLDRIWQVGVTTVIPNMTDAYADPWRERGQWWGDAYVDDHINRVAFGDTDLLKRGVLFMASAYTAGHAPGLAPHSDGSNMLDYMMLWVHSLAEYVQQTQDIQVLVNAYSVLRQFMDQLAGYENPTTGLMDLPQAPWWETVFIETLGYYDRYGQSTAVNALYYHTLLEAASIAEYAGDMPTALIWRQKGDAIKQGVNSVLYLPSEHRYLTNIYQGVPYPPSPQAQAWALAYGLVPDTEIDQVASSLLELLSSDPKNPNVEIYGMFWVLEALGRAGRFSDALNIIKNYYGYLLNLGAKTWWERFDANLYQWASLSHGWGGAPSWFLTTYILGVRQSGPDAWVVQPALAGVNHASGALPLKNGVLQVHWERQTCQDSHLGVLADVGSNGEVVVPVTDPTTVLILNGKSIWENGMPLAENVTVDPKGIHIILNGGNYDISIHQDCGKTSLTNP